MNITAVAITTIICTTLLIICWMNQPKDGSYGKEGLG